MARGWECPRCGKVNAPWKGSCDCRAEAVPVPVPPNWDRADDRTGPVFGPPTETTVICGACVNQLLPRDDRFDEPGQPRITMEDLLGPNAPKDIFRVEIKDPEEESDEVCERAGD